MQDTCSPGGKDCLCGPLDACDDGLVCSSQHCVPAIERALRIDAPGSRACELVLVDGNENVRGTQFGPGVQGARRQRGARNALAFISAQDVDLAGDQVIVQSVEGSGEAAEAYTLESARCFDRLGRPLEGASIAVAP